MDGVTLALLIVMSIALVMLITFTIIFLYALIKALKQVKFAAEKVQESADSAAELVDEVRRTVVNPGIIAVMIEKYLHGRFKTKKTENKHE